MSDRRLVRAGTEPHLYQSRCSFDGIELDVDPADRDWRTEGSDNVFGILHEEQPFTTWFLKPYLEQIAQRVPNPTFLDMGCGSGVYGIWVKKHLPQYRVISLDRNERAIQFAQHNASLNQVEVEFLHESYVPASLPEASCDVVGLYPPYHVYPDQEWAGDASIEAYIPQHAAGGGDGQGSFKEQLATIGRGRHLRPGGLVFFNQFCPGGDAGPEFLDYAPSLIGGNPSLVWVNVLEPIRTEEFLGQVQEGRYQDFTNRFSERYPWLYYTVGILLNDGLGRTEQIPTHTFDLKGRDWSDRIEIHRQFTAHAWR